MTLDPRPHSAAVMAAVTAQVGPDRTFDYGKVPGADGNPGTLPPMFVLVSLERRFVQANRMSARSSVTGWRIAVRCVGRSVPEVQWLLAKVAAALNEQRLTVDGAATTPIQHESDQAPEADDGLFSGLSVWTYA